MKFTGENDRKALLKAEIQRQISSQSYQHKKENRLTIIRMTLAGVCISVISFLVLVPFLEHNFHLKSSHEMNENEKTV